MDSHSRTVLLALKNHSVTYQTTTHRVIPRIQARAVELLSVHSAQHFQNVCFLPRMMSIAGRAADAGQDMAILRCAGVKQSTSTYPQSAHSKPERGSAERTGRQVGHAQEPSPPSRSDGKAAPEDRGSSWYVTAQSRQPEGDGRHLGRSAARRQRLQRTCPR